MNETEIVHNALERLGMLTGIKGNWKPGKNHIDGQIDIYFNNNKVHFHTEVKRELRAYQLPKIIETAKQHQPFMVVADHIFPTLKEALREKKIGYLDTAGNIYFDVNDKLIWLDGNKRVDTEKPATNRAFTKTGLKTVFYVLNEADGINAPYRVLAEATGVALGNIKNIIEGLREANFVTQVNKNTLRLQNKKALLERWITGYREILKPALHIGHYNFLDKKNLRNWQALPLQPGEGMWGGEPAAEHLTNHITPALLTFYTNEHKGFFIPRWRLVPDGNGNIGLYKKFWQNDVMDRKLFAPPLLIYTDLILTDDPRCIEAADIIYNKYLKNEFE